MICFDDLNKMHLQNSVTNETLFEEPALFIMRCNKDAPGSNCETDDNKVQEFFDKYIISVGYLTEKINWSIYGSRPTRSHWGYSNFIKLELNAHMNVVNKLTYHHISTEDNWVHSLDRVFHTCMKVALSTSME